MARRKHEYDAEERIIDGERYWLKPCANCGLRFYTKTVITRYCSRSCKAEVKQHEDERRKKRLLENFMAETAQNRADAEKMAKIKARKLALGDTSRPIHVSASAVIWK